MHQSVLVHADVDESPERGDVGHHTFEDHSRFEVGNLLDPRGKRRSGECRSRVAAGLLELGENVRDRRYPESFVGEVGRPDRSEGPLVADEFGQGHT